MNDRTERDHVVRSLTEFFRDNADASAQEVEALILDLAADLSQRGPRAPCPVGPFVLPDADSIEVPPELQCERGDGKPAAPSVAKTRPRAGSVPTHPDEAQAAAQDVARSVREHYRPTNQAVSFPDGATAVIDAPAAVAYQRLEYLLDHVIAQVRAGETPGFTLADAHRANVVHDRRGNVFVGEQTRPLALDVDGLVFVRILHTAALALENLRNGSCVSKRGLFYHHRTKLHDAHENQTDSDRALTALANILRVRRRSLGFVEARRGLVHGRLVVRDGHDVIDVSQLSPSGWSVPTFLRDFEILESSAEFILVLEKEAPLYHLIQRRWFETHASVLVTGNGFPSYSTREFVRTLVDTLGIPAFICTDADPSGLMVALTYAHGSISSALETPWLACNDLWWLGVYPTDFARFGLDPEGRIRMDKRDMRMARDLERLPNPSLNDRARQEVEVMLRDRMKLEMEAMHPDFFADEYLPKKLLDTDLIKL